MADMKLLTAKQKAFCEEYVNNGYNATNAYMVAYGVDKPSAKAAASACLKKPHVKEYVIELQKEAFSVACISAERVALKLAEIAFAEKGDADYNTPSQLKALDLLQKQLGLQQQNIKANVSNEIVINIEE